jgi:hypothetical protein
LRPLPNLGEGWGEGKPMLHSHEISEFGIAAWCNFLERKTKISGKLVIC